MITEEECRFHPSLVTFQHRFATCYLVPIRIHSWKLTAVGKKTV